MAFWDSERSLAAGVPYELHEFQLGDSGTYWRYADAPVDVVYGGHAFTACYCSGGRIEQGTTVLRSQTVVKVDWRNPFAWQYTVAAPEETVHYVRYKGYGADVAAIYRGDVADVVFRQSDRKGTRWSEIVIDPVTAAMQRSGLMTRYSRQCGVELYSELCGVLRSGHKTSGTLDSVSGTTLTSTAFGEEDDGWWAGGDIVVNGRRRKIVDHAGNDVVISPALPGVAAGQPFDVYPGCDHLIATCHTKFGNRDDYRGQPNIPDDDPFSQWGIL
ncbi:MAG: phage BR0599 family protein [Phycisphaerales bacterium]